MKDVRTKSQKIDPLSALAHFPHVRLPCEHTINFEKSGVFCTKSAESVSEEPPPSFVRTGYPPPLTADVLYGQPIIST